MSEVLRHSSELNLLRTGPEAAEQAWNDLVRAYRTQRDRLLGPPRRQDRWAEAGSTFRPDPHRAGDPEVEAIANHLQPGEHWLDAGAGSGRFALPLALRGARVTALDPSPSMLVGLREDLASSGIGGVTVIEGTLEDTDLPRADVALIAHVGYDIDDVGPFLAKLEAAARRLCIAVMFEEPPRTLLGDLWAEVFGEPIAKMPGMREFLSLLVYRGRLPEVEWVDAPMWTQRSPEDAIESARWRFSIPPGTEECDRLLRAAPKHLVETNGRWSFRGRRPALGVATWRP